MKDFKEFLAVWYASGLQEKAAKQAYDKIEAMTDERGEEPSEGEMALVYSNELTVFMLQAYHVWSNS